MRKEPVHLVGDEVPKDHFTAAQTADSLIRGNKAVLEVFGLWPLHEKAALLFRLRMQTSPQMGTIERDQFSLKGHLTVTPRSQLIRA